MMVSSTARRLSALVMVGALGLAGCGSSGSGASSEGGSATTATAKASDTTAAGGAASSAAATTTETTAKGSSSGGSSGDVSKAMVAAFKAIDKGDCDKGKELGDSLDLSANFDDGFDAIDDFAKGMDELASSGPSELRADFAAMSKGMQALADFYKELGIDDPSKIGEVMSDPAKAAKFEELGKVMEDPAFASAGERIGTWIEGKCPGLG